ncbi:MAG: MFS transporter [Muribaculaceae bacterium]|nr:MFS transporter [Muribaculaceae bacterium]
MDNIKQHQSKNIPAIVIMFCLFGMISFVTGFQNPCGVIVKEQFGLSDLESQLGNFANFIAYAFMGFPAGLILQNKGYKFTAITAVLIGLAGVALMFASTLPDTTTAEMMTQNKTLVYSLYISGAFVAGFSMCTLNTVVNPMLNLLGGGGKTGNQLLQFGGATNSLCATIVPILVGYLIGGNIAQATLINTRTALYIAMAIFFVAFIVLVNSKLPEPNREANNKEKVDIWGAFRFPVFVGGIIAIFLYVGIEVGVANFLNLYLTDKNGVAMTTELAGAIVGSYWFLMLIGRLIGGSVGGAVSSRTMLTVVSLLCIVLLICGIYLPQTKVTMLGYTLPLNAIFFVLCGLCTSVMWGGIFNLATEGLGKYTAIASGIFMVMVCGGGILPLLQGFVADFSDYVTSYWVLVAATAYLLFYAQVGSRKKA